MAYNKNAFLLASAKVLAAAFSVDKAIAKTASDVNAWAQMAVAGINEGKLTLADVKAQLIADYRFTLPKAEQADFDPETAKLADCGNTIKGWYYALARIVDAGADTMARITSGEAFNTVARETKPKQAQAGKKSGGKAPTADKPVTFAQALSSLHYHLDGAIANGERAAEMAANPQVIAILGKLAQLEKAASAYTKKATAKKAA